MFTTTDQKVSGLNPDGVTKSHSEMGGFFNIPPLNLESKSLLMSLVRLEAKLEILRLTLRLTNFIKCGSLLQLFFFKDAFFKIEKSSSKKQGEAIIDGEEIAIPINADGNSKWLEHLSEGVPFVFDAFYKYPPTVKGYVYVKYGVRMVGDGFITEMKDWAIYEVVRNGQNDKKVSFNCFRLSGGIKECFNNFA